MVQAGARNSGKFYAVLRPNGPNTMWLAFEDGDGIKFSPSAGRTFRSLKASKDKR